MLFHPSLAVPRSAHILSCFSRARGGHHTAPFPSCPITGYSWGCHIPEPSAELVPLEPSAVLISLPEYPLTLLLKFKKVSHSLIISELLPHTFHLFRPASLPMIMTHRFPFLCLFFHATPHLKCPPPIQTFFQRLEEEAPSGRNIYSIIMTDSLLAQQRQPQHCKTTASI